MDKFTTLEGVAAPLKIINVDTDMIIPKQYLKTIKRTGLGKGLFSERHPVLESPVEKEQTRDLEPGQVEWETVGRWLVDDLDIICCAWTFN